MLCGQQQDRWVDQLVNKTGKQHDPNDVRKQSFLLKQSHNPDLTQP